ncbi:MAG TPA: tetratricopeptide repeat protein [Candidatus Sulfotelmatobacter sp.]|nr:tetratricopeptide repeat protein [Candidatus Sulfotelmatobacter sp.]
MALFGFNKQKVLASAEKYVQQGKLQNAISEYEKILKNDAKDLTVTNTVGDLYSRLGETDKATGCFKTVGDAYGSQGFTVKAIAMYKKICKLQPSLESLLKLAELYSQQGLFNDARAQYLQVAEEFLKNGELENSVRIFQKILEMDPENSSMRVRLAEVYIRLGKKTEAWQIFSAAAESLRSKGSLSGAEEILQRMLTLDPGNTYALLMQGKNLIESGDAAGAVAALQKISDIDSNPDGLRDLLKAYLQTGQLSEAGTVANKLLTVHNDLGAIASFADALMQAGQYETALQVFDEHAERLLAENSDKVLESLHTIIGHVRDNPDSLQKLLDLFNKAGENTHVSEVIELLAHASVQAGDLPKARDLYQKLATVEPQNPLHMQNYQQVVSQLGGTSGSKLITPDEAVVLIDDLEATAPSVHQHYTDEIALAVRAALTDAELFISYNMPAKALGPLVGALPLAPEDLRLNQRLAALHTRAGRFAEAALCCRTLQNVYHEAEYPEEASRYGELAERYEERSSAPVPDLGAEEEHIFLDAPAPEAESAVEEFSVDESPAEEVAVQQEAAPEATAEQDASPWPAAEPAEEITVDAEPEFAVVDESAASAEAAAAPGEIDLSSEWDDSITVEEAEVPAVEAAEVEVDSAVGDHDVPDSGKVDETVEEIRFYLAHGMPEQAMAALAKLQTLTSDQAKLDEVRAEVEAATAQPADEEVAVEPVVEELSADDIPTIEVEADEISVDETPAPAEEPAVEEVAVEEPVVEEMEVVEPEIVEPEIVTPKSVTPKVAAARTAAPKPVVPKTVPPKVVAPEPPAIEEIPVVAESAVKAEPAVHAPVAQAPVLHPPVSRPPVVHAPVAHAPVVHPPEPEPETKPGVLKEFVSDLETSLGDNFLPGTVTKPAATTPAQPGHAPAPHSEPAVAAGTTAPLLGEFVADIEASLGEDFLKSAPVAEPSAAVPAAKTAHPMAASAAASGSVAHGAHLAPQSAPTNAVPVAAASVAWHAPVEAPHPPPAIPAAHAAAAPSLTAPTAAKASPFSEDAGIDIAEMFGELKHDLEADVASSDEDPETHYNLGIAFREMGLLDEAIGELQKACQAFDHGHPFPQIMQTYTWLAQCFLDKGVPEAAVRWYGKALEVPGIDGETRVALHYELAGAYEIAGDKPSALKHFMDVYGSNIDYRDVAERIKALKS